MYQTHKLIRIFGSVGSGFLDPSDQDFRICRIRIFGSVGSGFSDPSDQKLNWWIRNFIGGSETLLVDQIRNFIGGSETLLVDQIRNFIGWSETLLVDQIRNFSDSSDSQDLERFLIQGVSNSIASCFCRIDPTSFGFDS